MNKKAAFGALMALCFFAGTATLHAQDTLQSKQIVEQKSIDEGGSGLFKAVAVTEKSLPGYVVYRPKDLYYASVREKRLPVLIWCNGGCMDTSVDYERMLTEVASRGYVVIAIGAMEQSRNSRKQVHTESEMVGVAISWICEQVKDKKSDYYDCVDVSKMAAAGHSCGGAQVLYNAADDHLKTCLILNAGMGDMEMAGANTQSLAALHCPTLYITGGPQDVAYNNAALDYKRISHVPVVWGDMPSSGHAGTYNKKGGGDYGRMILSWLDWHLKGKTEFSKIFLQADLEQFPGWTMQHKGFNAATVSEIIIEHNGDRIYGIASVPPVAKKKVAIISHGFNGTHHFGRTYFDLLNSMGYIVYTFDSPDASLKGRSGNDTKKMSIFRQVESLKAVVKHFQQMPDVDKNNIVLIGESQGGLVSAMAGADLGNEISKLILVFPAFCIPDNWNSRYPKTSDIPEVTSLWNVPLGRQFFMELRKYDVYKHITKYTGPVQIIHGSKDDVVPLSYSERAMKEYKDAHLGVIPGAKHGFNKEERLLADKFVREFLDK